MKKSPILIIIIVIVSIVFFFLLGAAAFIFQDINSSYTPLASDNYSGKILDFVQNEQKSQSINDDIANGLSSSELITKLNNETIPIWRENRMLMEGLNQEQDLDESQKKEVRKLLQYSELKIELFETLKEEISENNGEHLPTIDSLNLEIDLVLKPQ